MIGRKLLFGLYPNVNSSKISNFISRKNFQSQNKLLQLFLFSHSKLAFLNNSKLYIFNNIFSKTENFYRNSIRIFCRYQQLWLVVSYSLGYILTSTLRNSRTLLVKNIFDLKTHYYKYVPFHMLNLGCWIIQNCTYSKTLFQRRKTFIEIQLGSFVVINTCDWS